MGSTFFGIADGFPLFKSFLEAAFIEKEITESCQYKYYLIMRINVRKI